ncbi:hypothetical protein [Cytobacillus spongiae]|nr:hypothetical protein [Cytobacillus spongiae]
MANTLILLGVIIILLSLFTSIGTGTALLIAVILFIAALLIRMKK